MKSYYFIGIKGAGMSALANILKNKGNDVIGSDIESYVFTEQNLRANGIDILPFSEENLKNKQFDVVIKGAAFNEENNIEVAYAKSNEIELTTYKELLGLLADEYPSVGISGTHGKTTTTGMLVAALAHQKLSYLIGDGTGVGTIEPDYFLFESCEYKRHFLAYKPNYLIITNIDFDHVDYFKDIDDVIDAFTSAANNTKQKVIGFGDDANVQSVKNLMASPENMVLFGEKSENDYIISNYVPTELGIGFTLQFPTGQQKQFDFPFFGKHMMLNAVSTLVVADLEGLDLDVVANDLSEFSGVQRRFNIEPFGTDSVIVDDYAHHPNEIEVTLQAAKQQFPNKEIIAIFQPHTFTRLQTLLDDFASVLSIADQIYITDIFTSAREKGTDVFPKTLLEKLPKAKWLDLAKAEELSQYKNSALIFMGAGDIQKYIVELKKVNK